MDARGHAEVWLASAQEFEKESANAPNEAGRQMVLQLAVLSAVVGKHYQAQIELEEK